ncbi:hypothetical protein MASR2M15_25440 [Anaerolineales bacterium]
MQPIKNSASPIPVSPTPSTVKRLKSLIRRGGGWLLKACFALSFLYGLGVSLITVLHFTGGERWVWMSLVNSFIHWLWLLAIPLWFFLILFKRWRLSLVLILPLFAFGMVYGLRFLPRPAAVTSDVEPLKILSFNTFMMRRQSSIDQLAELVRAEGVQVMLLQEVPALAETRLYNSFHEIFPYHYFNTYPGTGTAGMAFFSQYPIVSEEAWLYQLGQQRLEILIGDQRVVVYNLHLSHPGMAGEGFQPAYRQAQISDLLSRLERETLPFFIAGDFNLSDGNDDYQRLRAHYRDVYAESGWGWGLSFMADLPILRLDYVFINADYEALSARVLPDSFGSDHLPLLVEIGLLREGA